MLKKIWLSVCFVLTFTINSYIYCMKGVSDKENIKRTFGLIKENPLDGLLPIGVHEIVAGYLANEFSLVKTINNKKEITKFIIYNQKLITANEDNTINIYDLNSGLIKTIKGHDTNICSLDFCNEANYFASASNDSIKIWDAQTGDCLKTFNTQGNIVAGNVGKYLAVSDNNLINLYDLSSLSSIKTLNNHMSKITTLTFSSCGQYLISGDGTGCLKLWDTKTLNIIRETMTYSYIFKADFFLDNQYLIVTAPNAIKVLNLKDFSIVKLLNVYEHFFESKVSPDGKFLISADQSGKLTIRDLGIMYNENKDEGVSVGHFDPIHPDINNIGHVISQIFAEKPHVRALADTNVILYGLQTIDGVTLSDGDAVLLVAQKDGIENGFWRVDSENWFRPSYFRRGSMASGSFSFVQEGNTYIDSNWLNVNELGDFVGYSSLKFVNLNSEGTKMDAALNTITRLSFREICNDDQKNLKVKVCCGGIFTNPVTYSKDLKYLVSSIGSCINFWQTQDDLIKTIQGY